MRVLLLGALLAIACASGDPGFYLAEGHGAAPRAQRFLLLPTNVVVTLPNELEGSVQPVVDSLGSYLGSRGAKVVTIPYGDARREWIASIGDVKRAKLRLGFNSNVRMFAKRMCAATEFDAIVMPSIVVQDVEVRRWWGRWDGVRRRVPVVNEPRMAGAASYSSGLSGSFPAASLHVMVFSPEGERLFENRGGLDFIHLADMTDAMKKRRWTTRLREDPFGQEDRAGEAVRIALSPYLSGGE